ncbi:MAG: YCF48-related protein [Planctomycetes bacterium]|nr:YCF48-related protein [Planctomycetota bacterium]
MQHDRFPFFVFIACLVGVLMPMSCGGGGGGGGAAAATQPPVVVTPPTQQAPGGLTATPRSADIMLTWTTASGAQTYSVYRSTVDPVEVKSLNRIASSLTSANYIDASVTVGTKYYYVVTATGSVDESNPSTQVNATIVLANLPAAPTGINGVVGDGTVTLTWSGPGTAGVKYNVYRSNSATFQLDLSTKVGGNIMPPTYLDSNLTNGSQYYYVVTSQDTNGEGAGSSVAGPFTPTPPPAPAKIAGLSATPGDAQASLSWSSDPIATFYRIYRSTTAGFTPGATNRIANNISQTTYTDAAVVNLTTYYYRVTGVNVTTEGPASNENACTPVGKPQTPTSLSWTYDNARVGLSWNVSIGASSYEIHRQSPPGPVNTASGLGLVGNAAQPATGVTTVFYEDTSLPNNSAFLYRVVAVSATGLKSDDSNEVTAIPNLRPVPAGVGTSLTVTPGDSVLTVGWTADSTAYKYRIYRGTIAGVPTGSPNTPFAELFHPTNSYVDTAVTNGVPYFYAVTSYTIAGESGPSNEVQATPATSAAPTGVTATPNTGSITVSWTSVPGASSYNVYRSTASGVQKAPAGTPIGSAAASPYTDTNVTDGVYYYYIVTAVTGSVESNESNEAGPTLSVNGSAAPGAPNLRLQTYHTGSAVIAWDKVTGAISYNVYRGTASGVQTLPSSLPLRVNLRSLGFVDDTVTNGSTYFYRITAVSAGGESAGSAEAVVTPQPEFVVTYPFGTSNNLKAIFGQSAGELHAAGASGAIISSIDHGVCWGQQASNITGTIESLFASSPDKFYAVGASGAISTSADGKVWTPRNSGTTQSLNGVSGDGSSDIAWAVGAGSTILKSSNSGFTWSSQSSGAFTGTFNAVYAGNSSDVWIAGNGGLILKSTDGGANWSQQTSGVTSDLKAFYGLGTDAIYVVGASNTVLRTTDGGTSWTMLTTGTTGTNFESIHGYDANHIAVAGSGGTLLTSSDGGATWSTASTGVTQNIADVRYFGPSSIWAVGDSGLVIDYDGTNWNNHTGYGSSASMNFQDVQAFASNSVYVIGNNSSSIRWDGLKWVSMAPPTTNSKLRGIWGATNTSIYAVGVDSTNAALALYSSDGTTWTNITAQLPGSTFGGSELYEVWGLGNQCLWMVGTAKLFGLFSYNEYAARSLAVPPTTGSWASQSSSFVGNKTVRRAWGWDANNVILVSTSNTVWRTANGTAGSVGWSQPAPPGGGDLHGLWGTGASDIYICDSLGQVFHSSDGGAQTFMKQQSSTVNHLYQVWGDPSGLPVYSVGKSNTIVRSTNLPQFNVISPSGFASTDWQEISGVSGSDFWVVGVDTATGAGTVLRYH